MQGPREQGTKGTRDRENRGPGARGRKIATKNTNAAGVNRHVGLIEGLWEQYAPGGRNYMQIGGGIFLGTHWIALGAGWAFAGSNP